MRRKIQLEKLLIVFSMCSEKDTNRTEMKKSEISMFRLNMKLYLYMALSGESAV